MRRRLTYANVAATMALVFSMSGGALAASHYLINSTKQISPKVLKKLKGNAGAKGLTGSPGATGKEGPAGKEGPQGKEGSPGAPATKLFAQVTEEGTINVSSPGVEVSKFEPFVGVYRVNFGREISRCAVTVTQGAIPFLESPGASSGREVGSAVVDLDGPGTTFPNGYPSGDTAQVETFEGSTPKKSSFYIAVLC